MEIRIIEEHVRGRQNVDRSIDFFGGSSDNIPLGDFLLSGDEEPKVTSFEEKLGGATGRSFPAVKVGSFHMIWIEELNKWMGIEYQLLEHNFEGERYGCDERVYSSGPYRLGGKSAGLIRDAYDASGIELDDVLKTPPSEMEKRSKGNIRRMRW